MKDYSRHPAALLATALLCGALAACGREESDAEQDQPTTAPEETLGVKSQAQGAAEEPASAAEEQATSEEMSPTTERIMTQLRATCPMVVEGAYVTISDTEDGVALTFTTENGDVADLCTRVQHMAIMYQEHPKHGPALWHQMGRAGARPKEPQMGSPMPTVETKITNLDNGARLELTPKDPSQLENLRAHVRWHRQRLHAGECWMPREPIPTEQKEQ